MFCLLLCVFERWKKAIAALNGRFFGGRVLTAEKNTTQKCSMRMICQVERKKSEMFARTCDYKSETRTAGVGWDFMV